MCLPYSNYYYLLIYFTAELSEVLWNMVFQLGIGLSAQLGAALGVIVVFFVFAAWAGMFSLLALQ